MVGSYLSLAFFCVETYTHQHWIYSFLYQNLSLPLFDTLLQWNLQFSVAMPTALLLTSMISLPGFNTFPRTPLLFRLRHCAGFLSRTVGLNISRNGWGATVSQTWMLLSWNLFSLLLFPLQRMQISSHLSKKLQMETLLLYSHNNL